MLFILGRSSIAPQLDKMQLWELGVLSDSFFTQALVRQLKFESEVGAPNGAPGNVFLAWVWAFVPGRHQRPGVQNIYPHPQVPVGFFQAKGGRGGPDRLQASSTELTGAHSDMGGLPLNKVCLFPPRALGTPCQDRMTHCLPGLACLWETLSQGSSPRGPGSRSTGLQA